MIKWKLVNRKVVDLKEWQKNPRRLTEKGIKDLTTSIKKFGIAEPIVINKNNTICGGHGRKKVLVAMKIKEVACYMPSIKLTDKQMEELNIRLNKNIAGEFDFDMLANLFEYDDLIEYGFDEKELLGLDFGNGIDDEKLDEVPEVQKKAISKTGDLFLLDGKHRILCGDATNKADVTALMSEKKADMVFTDPPYGVNYSGGTQFKKNGRVEKNHRDKLINDSTPEIYDISVPIMAGITNGAIYTWFGSSKAINIFRSVAKVGDIHSIIVWVKGGGSGDLNSNYKQKHEMCMYWKPKKGKLNFIGATNEVNVWEMDKDNINKYHPTQKPVALGIRAIRNHKGNIVVDLFLGSGSTLIACQQTNRICYGMEIDPIYIDVILKRYKNLYPDSEIECLNRKFNFEKLW